MRLFRRAVILSHRYLGIVLSLLVIMWFATGITMIYWGGMPRVTPELRLERLQAVDFSRVTLTPAEAAERGDLDPIGRATLATLLDRPVYRFGSRNPTIVFADTGDLFDELSVDQAQSVAATFARVPASQVHHLATLHEVDQWTLQTPLPLYKFSVDDGAGTELYVQPQSGEVGMMTTRSSRGWAWVSTIPHWLYFTALRSNQPLWYRLLVWTSALACVLAVLGLVLGVTQLRKPRPFKLSKAIPYSGSMRWHYISGVVFGVFTLTFAFSGLLSMEPWDWASEGGLGEGMSEAFSGGPLDLAAFPDVNEKNWSAIFRVVSPERIREVEFLRIQGAPYYVVRGSGFDPMLATAQPLEIRRELFSESSLIFKAKQANPDVTITEATELFNYDSYYYSRDGEAPLPVLRLKFDDPDKTWFYIDPKLSRVLARYQRRERLQRWIYHGLHSLDFSFWYYSRPAWDIGVIVLCAGGAVLSVIGIVISLRRVRRDLRRIVQH